MRRSEWGFFLFPHIFLAARWSSFVVIVVRGHGHGKCWCHFCEQEAISLFFLLIFDFFHCVIKLYVKLTNTKSISIIRGNVLQSVRAVRHGTQYTLPQYTTSILYTMQSCTWSVGRVWITDYTHRLRRHSHQSAARWWIMNVVDNRFFCFFLNYSSMQVAYSRQK